MGLQCLRRAALRAFHGLARGQLPQHAAQQSAVQRGPREHGHPVPQTGRNDLEFDVPGDEVVDALLRDDPEEIPARGVLLGLRDVPAGEIGGADVTHFPLPGQVLHRLPHFVPGGVPVDVVHLEQVDPVRFQPPQGRIARGDDVARGKTGLIGPVVHGVSDLGGKDDLFPAAPAAGEPGAEELLGIALVLLPAVLIGGVQEIDAVVEGRVQDGVALLIVGPDSEVQGAETQLADLEGGATETGVAHGCLSGSPGL